MFCLGCYNICQSEDSVFLTGKFFNQIVPKYFLSKLTLNTIFTIFMIFLA